MSDGFRYQPMTLNIIVPLYICTCWFRNRFDDEMIQNLSFALGLAQVWTLFLTEALDKAIEFELVLVEGEHITDFEASPISERLWFFDWGRILNDFDLVMLFLLLSWGLVDPARPVLELAYNEKYIRMESFRENVKFWSKLGLPINFY